MWNFCLKRLGYRLSGALLTMAVSVTVSVQAMAQDGDTQQALSNPVASLTLVPFQSNYNRGFGPGDGDGYQVTTNIQPVIPFKLSDQLTLVTRTIVPVVGQESLFPGSGSQFGLGDTTQSFFFVPPTVNGFTWGAGPVGFYPTATDDLLGTGKWGAGPTAVVLQQTGPWTVGVLALHIWSFAGDEDRSEVNNTFLQPFITYGASGGITYAVNTESTYDWVSSEWSVPINVSVSKLTKIGDQPVQLQAGVRYWAQAPENGPEDWGARLAITFILP